MEKLQERSPDLSQEALLQRITHRVRQSFELQDILTATVTEVRDFLGTDRVKIYQFQPEGHGSVIAESVDENRLPALIGLNFPADDVPTAARELFVQARQRVVVDLAAHQIGISPLLSPSTGLPLEEPDIRYRAVDPCHVEYLTAMGVQSSVVVPIVIESQKVDRHSQPPALAPNTKLWGLLASHHSEPRVVSEQELAFIQAVVNQVETVITQAILLEQLREQVQREVAVNRITALLHAQPTVQLQTALEAVVAALKGSGGRLYLAAGGLNQKAELYFCGDQPEPLDQGAGRPIEEHRLWQKYLTSVLVNEADPRFKLWSVQWMRAVYALTELPEESMDSSNIWAINDLYKEPLFRTLAPSFQLTKIRGVLIFPIHHGRQIMGCLSIFRDEVDQEIVWAGYHNPDTRQLMARQSFKAWRELRRGEAQAWVDGEIILAQALGEHFSAAVRQYRLHQEVETLNTSLEQQVRDRTAQLQEAFDHLKRTQTHLIHTEKMSSLGQLVAGVAHEINNPANFIYGNLCHIQDYSQTLLNLLTLYQQDNPHPTAEIQTALNQAELEFLAADLPRMLASMKVGAERIREIVLSLQNFSRNDQAEIKSVDIHEGLESTLLILHHRLKETVSHPPIEVVKQYGNLPLVECYAGQLNQVFMHLLSNAIDALQPLRSSLGLEPDRIPTIAITTQIAENGGVQISIKDNGVGMQQDVKEKLFDPFFTTKPVGKGTGLGLSICHQIVERHGGSLRCLSEINQGAEFILEIPLKQA